MYISETSGVRRFHTSDHNCIVIIYMRGNRYPFCEQDVVSIDIVVHSRLKYMDYAAQGIQPLNSTSLLPRIF